MDFATIIGLVFGGSTILGFIALIYFAYRNGKITQQGEQDKHDTEVIKQLQFEFNKPKSSSNDDRDSLHNGDF